MIFDGSMNAPNCRGVGAENVLIVKGGAFAAEVDPRAKPGASPSTRIKPGASIAIKERPQRNIFDGRRVVNPL